VYGHRVSLERSWGSDSARDGEPDEGQEGNAGDAGNEPRPVQGYAWVVAAQGLKALLQHGRPGHGAERATMAAGHLGAGEQGPQRRKERRLAVAGDRFPVGPQLLLQPGRLGEVPQHWHEEHGGGGHTSAELAEGAKASGVGRLVAERRAKLIGAEQAEEARGHDDGRAQQADREAARLIGP